MHPNCGLSPVSPAPLCLSPDLNNLPSPVPLLPAPAQPRYPPILSQNHAQIEPNLPNYEDDISRARDSDSEEEYAEFTPADLAIKAEVKVELDMADKADEETNM